MLLLCGAAGCAAPQYCPLAPLAPTEKAIIFVADGAGDFLKAADNLTELVCAAQLPFRVVAFDWSHGFCRVIADQTDYCYARCQGRCLAGEILKVRQTRPDVAIYVIGYSAGSGVALAAAEHLPPNTIDGMVLLSPSISHCYDLRPSLQAVRGHIDNFYSCHDLCCLGLGTAILGTADRLWTAPAGRVGFSPCAATPAEMALYGKLRQHPWHPCIAWTGNMGGHYGVYHKQFLDAYVLPLLCGGPS